MEQPLEQPTGTAGDIRWTAILRDVQFWVPLIVLLIGLALLGIAR